ncbi:MULTISPECIES: hypothetical protein [unclassified Sphingobium]|uniref:hypothetical protein n=1 Tax=unclassified Sphingobium TaxID=2611147 RepID=UPI001123E6AD|nr:hypothetical protein [Sphingobium sp. GW456-12-10-14-TSB1]
MRTVPTVFVAFAIAACSSPSDQPEVAAVRYAEDHFGRKSFDPDGKGYNINVIDCGNLWCVSLHPAFDPKTFSLRYAGGGIEMELRKSDSKVVSVSRTQ